MTETPPVYENGDRLPGVDYSGAVWMINGNTVQEYDGSTDPEYDADAVLKIFRYIGMYLAGPPTAPPFEVDYITGLNRRLYRQEYFVRGELQRVEFYAETSTGSDGWPAYDDLVITEDIEYTRDSLGFAKHRTTTITWIREDGVGHPITKVLHKPYSLIESQKEGVSRRSNIINQLSLTVAGVLLQILAGSIPDPQARIDVGREFMQTHKTAMDMFVSASKRDIVAIVKYAPDSWLSVPVAAGVTVRDLILDEVDIWGIRDSV